MTGDKWWGVGKKGILRTYMKAAFELPVSSELYANHFVEQQAHQIEGLGDGGAFIPGLGHDGHKIDSVAAGS
jgi:hypothetical protein